MAETVRVLTVGTGAIGSVYSWRLAQSCEVTTVCRSNYQAALEKGFEIDSAKWGQAVFKPHHVARSVQEANTYGPFDYVLVTLKALPDVYDVADIIAPAIIEGKTTIVLIQNGFGIEAPIAKRFPRNPLISIVAYIGVSQIGHGKIKMTAIERLQVGTYDVSSVESKTTCERFKEYLEKGDVAVESVEDIEQTRWEKLFWNGSFSPVCAILGLNTTQVIENEEAIGIVKRLMREIMEAAAAATGAKYEIDDRIEALVTTTVVGAPAYKPSMQLDLERKQPMEVEVILGTVLRSAKKHGVSTPTLETMYSLCRSMNIHNIKANM